MISWRWTSCTIVQSRIVTLRVAIDRDSDAHGSRPTFTIPVRVPSPIPVQTHKHDRYQLLSLIGNSHYIRSLAPHRLRAVQVLLVVLPDVGRALFQFIKKVGKHHHHLSI